jgi:hypothetical protein
MLRLAKAFLDIALWRRTPAHLPASALLLALVALSAALLEVVGTLLPPISPVDVIFTRVVLAVVVPLCFTWLVLLIARHRQRFLQTGSALLGVGVLAGIVLYPLDSLVQLIGEDQPVALPLIVVLFAAWTWYLLVCANIWRSALDSGLMLGGVISVGYLLLSLELERQWLPHA